MTQQDAVQNWMDGAREELEQARILHENGKYRGALFHSHLAVEKALKSAFVAEKDKDAPRTHNLIELATALNSEWTDEQKSDFAELTQFVVDARYADPVWAENQATEEGGSIWLKKCEVYISLLES